MKFDAQLQRKKREPQTQKKEDKIQTGLVKEPHSTLSVPLKRYTANKFK